MNKIQNINYQGRNIAIEDGALATFQTYEAGLKNYFLAQPEGEEIFHDLQYRMAEIMESKLQKGALAITEDDIQEIKSIIGDPSQFNADENANETTNTYSTHGAKTTERKKLYRSLNEKQIGGVCYGLANYFNIDPLAVRMLFVLVTLLGFGIGILTYIILWMVLPAQKLEVNFKSRLFRNPKDTVIAGVCGGIAEFFNIESWVVRVIFISPILLNMAASHNFHFGTGNLAGISIVTYVIIWATTRYAKTNTDIMQMQNTPVNINTITDANNYSIPNKNKSPMNKIFRVLAYILIIVSLIFFIPSTVIMSFGSWAIYPIASKVLFTPFMKFAGLCAILLVFVLPIVALGIWFIRRLAKMSSPNRPLRTFVFSLFGIGLISMVIVAFYFIANFGKVVEKKDKYTIPTSENVLYIKSLDSNGVDHSELFNFYTFDELVKEDGNGNLNVKGIRLDWEETSDSVFSYQIEKYACDNSRNMTSALSKITFEPYVSNNTLYLPDVLKVPANEPYKLQNLKVTIFVPKGKKAIVDKSLRNKLRHNIVVKRHNCHVSSESEVDEDEVFEPGNSNSSDGDYSITVTDENNKKVKARINVDDAKIEIKEAEEDAKEKLQDARERIREAEQEIERINLETKQKLERANDKLNKAMSDTTR